jgi:hypothetical protein
VDFAMFDAVSVKALIVAEWAAIHAAPVDFAVAVVIGWFVGWLLIRAWYRREISSLKQEKQSAETATRLVEGERDIERRQKEGLKQAFLEQKPGAPILALEVGYGDPDVRNIVERLAGGEKIQTSIPVRARGLTVGPVGFLTPTQIKQLAAVAYTAGVGLSKIERTDPVVIGMTGTTASVNAAAQSLKKAREEK